MIFRKFAPSLALSVLSWALLCGAVPAARAVTIVHSNDVLGEIEPCGCRTNPLGGMARKANYLKRISDPDVIQLDGGDFLFQTDEVPETLKAQTLLQARYLIKAADMTGLNAVVPGEKEFALGFHVFDELRKTSKIHFLAANLKGKSGKKLFESSLVLKKKGADGKPVTIAIFGIVDPSLNWPKDLKGSPAIAAAKAQVKELRKKADYVIALTHEGADKDQELAKAVPGIDLIVGGHTQSFLQVPLVIGTTHIYQSSFRNQYIGSIPLSKPLNDENYKLTALDPGYDSPSDAPSAMDDLVKEFKTAIAKLNSEEETKMEGAVSKIQPAGPKGEDGATKYHTFPRCAECHLKQFDFWRKTMHAKAYSTLFEAKQNQNKDCLQCHTVGLGDPKGFSFVTRIAEIRKSTEGEKASIIPVSPEDLHAFLKSMREADSLDTLVKLTAQSEPAPLKTALNSLDRSFTPVQCENCHQPGKDHPFTTGYTKTVARDTCLQCHTGERAPEWYLDGEKGKQPNWKLIESKRASITCPAGDLAPQD